VSVEATPTEEQIAQSRALFFEGIAHFENRRLEPARVCFEKCQALTPGRPSVLGNLGITLFHLRRWEAAILVLREATAADPALAEAWGYLGLAHEAQRQWKAAAEALEKATAVAPEHAGPWLSLARVSLELGDVNNALRAFDRALERDPKCATAWSDRGNVMRELQQYEEAARCFAKALELGGDAELNSYYLASVRDGNAPTTPPRRYVEGLFDGYAADFRSHVVETLGYRGFEVLLKPLLDAGKRYRHVLDLGCGTGLCGPLIAPRADVLDGVDISRAMLDEARKLGVYRELIHADLGEFLAMTTLRPDLMVAADVFIYVGELAAVFRSARRILEPGGCLAFTVEPATQRQDVELLPSLRYAHSETYLRRVAVEAGFTSVRVSEAPIRRDQTTPIMGLYVYLQ